MVQVQQGELWLRGQAVKTSPFHGGNTGSIPVGVINIYADVAQLAEQLICNQQVIGSSPIIGLVPLKWDITFWTFSSVGESNRLITGRSWVRVPEGPFKYFGPVAQLVRAPPCHGGGRGFESHLGRHFM